MSRFCIRSVVHVACAWRLFALITAIALSMFAAEPTKASAPSSPPPPSVNLSDPKLYNNPQFDELQKRVENGTATEEEQRYYGWLLPRVAPYKAIPDGAYDYARWQQDQLSQGSVSVATAGQWQDYGPTNVEGRVMAIALQANTSIVYAGGENGGIWKSTDTGATWTTKTDQLPDLQITDIKFLPGSTSTLFAGGGTGHFYWTIDSGATWTTRGVLPDGGLVDRIQINPQVQATIYAIEQKLYGGTGVYKSTDQGQNWTKIPGLGGGSGEHNDLVMDPTNPSILYAMFEGDGFYKTINAGSTWTKLSGGLPTNFGRGAIGIAPSNPAILYATADDNTAGTHRLYQSLDSGANWTVKNNPGHCCLGEIAVDQNNSSLVYFQEFAVLYKSTNAGVTLADISSTQAHGDQESFAIQPGNSSILWAGNDGGIERSTNQGSSWTDLHGMGVTEFYDIAAAKNDPSRITGGSQDNGIDAWTGSSGHTYTFTPSVCGIGDIAEIVIDPTNSQKQYAKGSGGAGVGSSSDGGLSWQCNVGYPSGVQGHAVWESPLTMSPRDTAMLDTAWLEVDERRWDPWPYISDHLEAGLENATSPLVIPTGATMKQWIYIPTGGVPNEIMLQFFATDGSGWEHRAYWGENIINFGVNGTASRWPAGAVPSGRAQWVLLSVPASSVGLAGKSIRGWAYDIDGGQVYWDHSAVLSGSTETVWVEDGLPPGATTFGYGSNVWTWVSSPKYTGTQSHYQSGSYNYWFSLGAPGTANKAISAIGQSNQSTRRDYTGYEDGRLFYTADRGNSWAERTGPWNGRYITSIAVDPNNDAVAYVTLGGVGGSHVYKTTNYGVSWSNVGGSLPDITYWDVAMSPLNSSRVIVVNDVGGVYESLNGGSSWAVAGDPNTLPNCPIKSIAFVTGVDLTVGTYGRGAWRLAGSQP